MIETNIGNNIGDFIRYIHLILIGYVFVGHYITPIQYIKYYLLLIIFIFLDWNDYDGQCILTKLEHYFRTGEWNQKPAIESMAPEFFRPIIQKIFNLSLTRLEADRLNNFLFMGCFLLGFYRIIYHYNI
jgi:hypothetical protein